MTTLRAAAQQALEALEMESNPTAVVEVSAGRWELKSDLAIAALRAALAEPQEPVVDAAIHAAWTAGFVEGEKAAWAEPVECSHGECFGGECIYTHQSQRPAEPVQEPDHTYKRIGCVQHDCEECQRRTQRKPLTEEEIMQAFDDSVPDYVDVSDAEMIDFARAVERAHKIGGEG